MGGTELWGVQDTVKYGMLSQIIMLQSRFCDRTNYSDDDKWKGTCRSCLPYILFDVWTGHCNKLLAHVVIWPQSLVHE